MMITERRWTDREGSLAELDREMPEVQARKPQTCNAGSLYVLLDWN